MKRPMLMSTVLEETPVKPPPIACLAKHQLPEAACIDTFHWTSQTRIPTISSQHITHVNTGGLEWYDEMQEVLLCYYDHLTASDEDFPFVLMPGHTSRNGAYQFTRRVYQYVIVPLRKQGADLAIHWYYATPSDSSVAEVYVAFGYPGLYELTGI